MQPNKAGSLPFVLKHTTSYWASEVIETLLVVDNAILGICFIYVWIVLMPLNARAGSLRLFRLHPTFFWYHNIKHVLLETWAPNCEIIPAKHLFFRSQKITATDYYDTEYPLLPDVN